eukprot:g2160.t1
MVETCHSISLAKKLNQVLGVLDRSELDILVQVNTSGEDSKSGVDPKDVIETAKFIHDECERLRFAGLMTIGVPDSTSERPKDFIELLECRDEVCEALKLDPEQLEISMGMSGDFEQAIEMGSTNVRVGSAIFGARSYPSKEAVA